MRVKTRTGLQKRNRQQVQGAACSPTISGATGKRATLCIDYLQPDSLSLDPENARIHSDRQIHQIGRSIAAFGFNVPILIDANGRVIAGHGRVLAARSSGLSSIPVIRLEHLTAEQARAFAIADNKLTENSEWNEQLLAEQLKILSEADLDFNLEAIGFETAELDLLIQGLGPLPDGADDPADQIVEPDSTISITQPGDLWSLGRHRILCGDALDELCYAKLMGGRKAAGVFTDPPYNVPIDRYACGFGKIKHREFSMASGEMSEAEFTQFLTGVCSFLRHHSAEGSLHYVCMDWHHIRELLAAAEPNYSEFKALCVWNKGRGGMGSFYRSQHELIFVFKNGTAPHHNNVQLGQFGRYRTNVWDYPGVNSFGRKSPEGDLLKLHPTTKPVALVADAILDCSKRGDIVLDSFLGSGTTLIAAERTGRICYGIEIDHIYVDTIIRRWQTFTGLSATHTDSGKPFHQLEKERIPK